MIYTSEVVKHQGSIPSFAGVEKNMSETLSLSRHDLSELKMLADTNALIGRDAIIREYLHEARVGRISKFEINGNHVVIGFEWQAIGGIVEGNPWRLYSETFKSFGFNLDDLERHPIRPNGTVMFTLHHRLQLEVGSASASPMEKPAGPPVRR